VLLAALTLPKIDGEDLEQFSKRVMADAFVESTAARDKGAEIHKDIETLFKFNGGHLMHPAISIPAHEKIMFYCNNDQFTTEQTVSGDGYGGAVDLYNDEFILDIKTKDISNSDWTKYEDHLADPKIKPPKLAYPEMCMQLSAYDEALWSSIEPGSIYRQGDQGRRRMVNVFVDREIPGRVIFYEWEERMYHRFKHLVDYWQDEKNYYPGRK